MEVALRNKLETRSYLSQSLDLVKNHGFVGKLDQGLGHGEGERAETGSKAWFNQRFE